MKAHKHTPDRQAKFRTRDTLLRDGLGTKKVDVAKLEENLRRAREAGAGPLLKAAPIQAHRPNQIAAATEAAKPEPGTYEVLDELPQDVRRRCHTKYATLERQVVMLPVGKGLIWTDAPTGRTTAPGVILRIGRRHGLKLRTYLDGQGRRIVWKVAAGGGE